MAKEKLTGKREQLRPGQFLLSEHILRLQEAIITRTADILDPSHASRFLADIALANHDITQQACVGGKVNKLASDVPKDNAREGLEHLQRFLAKITKDDFESIRPFRDINTRRVASNLSGRAKTDDRLRTSLQLICFVVREIAQDTGEGCTTYSDEQRHLLAAAIGFSHVFSTEQIRTEGMKRTTRGNIYEYTLKALQFYGLDELWHPILVDKAAVSVKGYFGFQK